MQYKNEYKKMVMSRQQLLDCHLSISPADVQQFWQTRTYLQMQHIFCLYDQSICEYLRNLIEKCLDMKYTNNAYFLQQKKLAAGTNEVVAYLYDGRMFRRNNQYPPECNELLSAFIMSYKQKDVQIDQLQQFTDPTLLGMHHWMIKIKASSILKMYSQIMSSLHNARQQNDIIVLPQERYANFMHLWMEYNTSHQGQLETVIKCFFRGLFLLLENQLLLELYNNLDESARNQRRYFRPIKSIEKPKNIEQFTLIDRRYGEINWQSLTVPVFKLKYRVIENDNYYLCYRMKEQLQEEGIVAETEDDMCLIAAFQLHKSHFYL